jgi:F0F1-type ATP synthase delta subunit
MNFVQFAAGYKYAALFLKIAYPTPGTAPIDEYKKFSEFFEKNPGLVGLVCMYPCREDCTNLLENFFASKFNLGLAEKKLIRQLIFGHKIKLLPTILKELVQIEHERLNQLPCTIELSHPVSDETLQQLKKQFEIQEKLTLIPTIVINPKLICGLKIYSQTKLYDYSIKKILNTLKSNILTNGGL